METPIFTLVHLGAQRTQEALGGRRRSRIADNIGREVEDSAEGRGARSDYDSAKTTAGAA